MSSVNSEQLSYFLLRGLYDLDATSWCYNVTASCNRVINSIFSEIRAWANVTINYCNDLLRSGLGLRHYKNPMLEDEGS